MVPWRSLVLPCFVLRILTFARFRLFYLVSKYLKHVALPVHLLRQVKTYLVNNSSEFQVLRTIPPAHLVHVDSGRYWILNMRSRYSTGLLVIDWPQSGNSFWTCVAMRTCTSCACMLVRVDNGRYWVLDIHLYSTGLLVVTLFGNAWQCKRIHHVHARLRMTL